MGDVDRAIGDLASRQGGACSRAQVLALGGNDAYIHRRCAAGAWTKELPGVFRIAGVPRTATARLWVAFLGVGRDAVRSFECAAEAERLHPVMTGRLVFTSRHGDHHRLPGVVVHQLRDVLPRHVTMLDGMPTTTPARTVVDLAAVVSFERLKRVVENAVNEKVTTDDDISRALGDVARPGKRGMKRLARVLDLRAPGEPVPASELERLLLGALRSVGLPDPIPQYPHPGREIGVGWVDYAYPDTKVILEADGRRWHQRIADIGRDRARDKAANRVGWLTMRFMHEELRRDPEGEGRSVIDTLAHRTAA